MNFFHFLLCTWFFRYWLPTDQFYSFQEVAIDAAGPLDDGTESIGDAPSLSEEISGYFLNTLIMYDNWPILNSDWWCVYIWLYTLFITGSSFEVKPSEGEAPQETILSEEGHQVVISRHIKSNSLILISSYYPEQLVYVCRWSVTISNYYSTAFHKVNSKANHTNNCLRQKGYLC